MISRVMKGLGGVFEGLLAIPFFGGLFILLSGYSPLWFMLVFHIVGLLLAVASNRGKAGHIFGIATSVIGWIPFLGWIFHVITAIILLIEAAIDR